MTIEELKQNVYELAGEQRRDTFVKAIEQAYAREARHIVEVGTVRVADKCPDGLSTLIFALYCELLKIQCYSVDISKESIAQSKLAIAGHEFRVNYVQADSVMFLSNHHDPIDLLYLDSYDYEENNPLPSQLHQMAELGAAYGKLSPKALVLMDDCNIPGGGKGLLSAQFLDQRGWKLIGNGYQKLYSAPTWT